MMPSMRSLPKPVAIRLAVFLIAGSQSALAQQCPPNSHMRAVATAGNLRTAHCWCNEGYENVAGTCVRVADPSPPQPPTSSPIPLGAPVR